MFPHLVAVIVLPFGVALAEQFAGFVEWPVAKAHLRGG
jgi:hypothetical protein